MAKNIVEKQAKITTVKGYELCEVYKIKNRDKNNLNSKCNGGEGMPDECKLRETCPMSQRFKEEGPWHEDMPINNERDEKVLKQIIDDEKEARRLERELMGLKAEAEGEKQRQEMTGKPIQWRGKFKPLNDDEMMTAEERAEKFPIIPTRLETRIGSWEIVDEYKKMDTLVGFRSKTRHEFGPLGQAAPSIVLTVEEWYKLYNELEAIMASLIL